MRGREGCSEGSQCSAGAMDGSFYTQSMALITISEASSLEVLVSSFGGSLF